MGEREVDERGNEREEKQIDKKKKSGEDGASVRAGEGLSAQLQLS